MRSIFPILALVVAVIYVVNKMRNNRKFKR
ncbi:hypothetical protein SAMN05216293_0421 [Flagellimonas taeanensis]|uniref:Uncharacterized protein n=1 Tax=Flagellimonas taeanensis TaxID=1005926 RepID=A0A1M6Q2K4_9FLAO|nr:hypothetical protein SAMN05216293_0421 [Allomuricauda taeanensis]